MEEPQLMEFSKEKSSRSDQVSFKSDVFPRWPSRDFPKILNQVPGIGDFQREKVSLIERPENRSMDGSNGLNGWNSGGSNLLCDGEFPK